MRIIVECDGPVLDVQPAFWAAYGESVAAVGLARTDPARFWRLFRTGAASGELISGAKRRHIATFDERFAAAVESDACLSQCGAQQGADEALRRLTAHAECVLVTVGDNRAARQHRLDKEGLSAHFHEMHGIFRDSSRRAEQLRRLAGEDRRVVVAASTVGLVRATTEAGLVCVGVYNGCVSGRRLTQAGAGDTYADLAELAADLEAGAPRLTTQGLLPARA